MAKHKEEGFSPPKRKGNKPETDADGQEIAASEGRARRVRGADRTGVAEDQNSFTDIEDAPGSKDVTPDKKPYKTYKR